MKFIETKLKGAYIIELTPHKDERGIFIRTFCEKEFQEIEHFKKFVQFNHSVNFKKGTIRGMHYQNPSFAETKLIRCINGSVFDVFIDIRNNSPTFLQWHGAEISKENMKMVFIPEGFAHGFQTLEDNTELLYYHTAFYNPNAEGNIRYDDPSINIKWPFAPAAISPRDSGYSFLTNNFKGMPL